MQQSSHPPDRRREGEKNRLLEWLRVLPLPGIVVIIPFAPKWSPFILFFCALSTSLRHVRHMDTRPILTCTLLLAALALWCLISALWSTHPSLSLRQSVEITILFALALLTSLHWRRWLKDPEARRRFARLTLAATAFTTGILWIEILSNGWIIFTLYAGLDFKSAPLVYYNRAATQWVILVFLIWPLGRLASWPTPARTALILAMVGCIWMLESETAKIASLAGILALLGAWACGRRAGYAAIATLAFIWAALPALITPLGTWLTSQIPVQESLQLRFALWEALSRFISENPLLGAGVQMTRFLPDIHEHHPHNGVLQLWVESGAVGAILGFALMATLAQRISRTEPLSRCCGLASLAAAFACILAAYGIWQTHWLAVLALSTLTGLIALPQTEHKRTLWQRFF